MSSGPGEAGPSYFFISLVQGPLNSLLLYVPSSRYIWNTDPILFLQEQIERVMFIGTQFSNLYTAVDTPAKGRVGNKRHHHHLSLCVSQPHSRARASSCPAAATSRPAAATPTPRPPNPRQQDGWKIDVLLSANSPPQDVTAHLHRPGARPDRPCPVPACLSGAALSSGAPPVVRLDVVPFPPRSSTLTVAGCRLG